MNITTADYFTFNIHNSLLLTGKSGSGKSYLVHTLLARYTVALTPRQFQCVIFDLKQVEFQTNEDIRPEYLHYPVITDANKGLNVLDELAILVKERATQPDTAQSLLFIYIEECDMARLDQKRFDDAVISINDYAREANTKLIYSTSNLSQSSVSERLVRSFDLMLSGDIKPQDSERFGMRPIERKAYEFLVMENAEIRAIF